jgi:hypothetical protein
MRATILHIDGLITCSCRPFGDIRLISTSRPVSEATVERIFSHVRDFLGQHNQGMNSDLLEARVIAKLNGFLNQDSHCQQYRAGIPDTKEFATSAFT